MSQDGFKGKIKSVLMYRKNRESKNATSSSSTQNTPTSTSKQHGTHEKKPTKLATSSNSSLSSTNSSSMEENNIIIPKENFTSTSEATATATATDCINSLEHFKQHGLELEREQFGRAESKQKDVRVQAPLGGVPGNNITQAPSTISLQNTEVEDKTKENNINDIPKPHQDTTPTIQESLKQNVIENNKPINSGVLNMEIIPEAKNNEPHNNDTTTATTDCCSVSNNIIGSDIISEKPTTMSDNIKSCFYQQIIMKLDKPESNSAKEDDFNITKNTDDNNIECYQPANVSVRDDLINIEQIKLTVTDNKEVVNNLNHINKGDDDKEAKSQRNVLLCENWPQLRECAEELEEDEEKAEDGNLEVIAKAMKLQCENKNGISISSSSNKDKSSTEDNDKIFEQSKKTVGGIISETESDQIQVGISCVSEDDNNTVCMKTSNDSDDYLKNQQAGCSKSNALSASKLKAEQASKKDLKVQFQIPKDKKDEFNHQLAERTTDKPNYSSVSSSGPSQTIDNKQNPNEHKTKQNSTLSPVQPAITIATKTKSDISGTRTERDYAPPQTPNNDNIFNNPSSSISQSQQESKDQCGLSDVQEKNENSENEQTQSDSKGIKTDSNKIKQVNNLNRGCKSQNTKSNAVVAKAQTQNVHQGSNNFVEVEGGSIHSCETSITDEAINIIKVNGGVVNMNNLGMKANDSMDLIKLRYDHRENEGISLSEEASDTTTFNELKSDSTNAENENDTLFQTTTGSAYNNSITTITKEHDNDSNIINAKKAGLQNNVKVQEDSDSGSQNIDDVGGLKNNVQVQSKARQEEGTSISIKRFFEHSEDKENGKDLKNKCSTSFANKYSVLENVQIMQNLPSSTHNPDNDNMMDDESERKHDDNDDDDENKGNEIFENVYEKSTTNPNNPCVIIASTASNDNDKLKNIKNEDDNNIVVDDNDDDEEEETTITMTSDVDKLSLNEEENGVCSSRLDTESCCSEPVVVVVGDECSKTTNKNIKTESGVVKAKEVNNTIVGVVGETSSNIITNATRSGAVKSRNKRIGKSSKVTEDISNEALVLDDDDADDGVEEKNIEENLVEEVEDDCDNDNDNDSTRPVHDDGINSINKTQIIVCTENNENENIGGVSEVSDVENGNLNSEEHRSISTSNNIMNDNIINKAATSSSDEENRITFDLDAELDSKSSKYNDRVLNVDEEGDDSKCSLVANYASDDHINDDNDYDDDDNDNVYSDNDDIVGRCRRYRDGGKGTEVLPLLQVQENGISQTRNRKVTMEIRVEKKKNDGEPSSASTQGHESLVGKDGMMDVNLLVMEITSGTAQLHQEIDQHRRRGKEVSRLLSHIHQLKREVAKVKEFNQKSKDTVEALQKEVNEQKAALALACDLAELPKKVEQMQRVEAKTYKRYLKMSCEKDAKALLKTIGNKQKSLVHLEALVQRKRLILKHALPMVLTVDSTTASRLPVAIKQPRKMLPSRFEKIQQQQQPTMLVDPTMQAVTVQILSTINCDTADPVASASNSPPSCSTSTSTSTPSSQRSRRDSRGSSNPSTQTTTHTVPTPINIFSIPSNPSNDFSVSIVNHRHSTDDLGTMIN